MELLDRHRHHDRGCRRDLADKNCTRIEAGWNKATVEAQRLKPRAFGMYFVVIKMASWCYSNAHSKVILQKA